MSTSEGSKKKWLVLAGYFASMQDEGACKEKVSGKAEHYWWDRSLWNREEGVEGWCWSMAQYHPHQSCHVPGSDTQSVQWEWSFKLSLDCYRNFLSGWVREVLVMPIVMPIVIPRAGGKILFTKFRIWQYPKVFSWMTITICCWPYKHTVTVGSINWWYGKILLLPGTWRRGYGRMWQSKLWVWMVPPELFEASFSTYF